jgi:hypothetical protein
MNMKAFLAIVALSILTSVGIVFAIRCNQKSYKVEIQFCDDRPSVITTVKSLKEPSRYIISNINKGVPSYEGYLNVCDVKVLKKYK